MNSELKLKMKKVLWRILEQHSFLMLEEEIYVPKDISAPYVDIKMSFLCNDYVGYFRFLIPESLSNEIESNLTGEQIKDGEFDGGKEMLNIIGANVLTELYGSSARINVSLPSCETINPSMLADESKRENAVTLGLNGLPIILVLVTGTCNDC